LAKKGEKRKTSLAEYAESAKEERVRRDSPGREKYFDRITG